MKSVSVKGLRQAAFSILIGASFIANSKTSSELQSLEQTLASLHAEFIDAFLDGSDKAKVREEQVNWSASLIACEKKIPCLSAQFSKRVRLLKGRSSEMVNAGIFKAVNGDIVLYPIGDAYLIQIQTVDAMHTKWTCHFSGSAAKQSQKLVATNKNDSNRLMLSVPTAQRIDIGVSKDENLLSRDYCGLNGSFVGRFVRKK
jgi:uncharacterized protein